MRILSSQLETNIEQYADQFANGKPFRHVLIPDFFSKETLALMLQEFPRPDPTKMFNEFGKPNKKFACSDVKNIGPIYRAIDQYIQTPEFADLMGRITGIPNLLYDPEYHGAGTHDNLSGQGMDVHIDFNLHRTTGFHRRVNAIIYLNPVWEEKWGGY